MEGQGQSELSLCGFVVSCARCFTHSWQALSMVVVEEDRRETPISFKKSVGMNEGLFVQGPTGPAGRCEWRKNVSEWIFILYPSVNTSGFISRPGIVRLGVKDKIGAAACLVVRLLSICGVDNSSVAAHPLQMRQHCVWQGAAGDSTGELVGGLQFVRVRLYKRRCTSIGF